MWNYVVTAQKPTSVSKSLVGHFTSPTDMNLIICKGTRIEIHLLTPEGLHPLLDVGIYGRIATMELYRPPEEKQDLLFLSTERYKFCILAYDSTNKEIVTRANGDVQDRIGRPADIGQLGIVDPETRIIGLHLYDGMFKAIPMSPKGLQEAFNMRFEELQVVDMKFLHNCGMPTIALLFQDTKDCRHVKTYAINVREKEFEEGPWSLANVEGAASLLIPMPGGGAIIIGEQTITYHSGNTFKSISMKTTIIKAYGKVDNSRYLLGDQLGNLYMLVIEYEDKKISDMKLEYLGETSVASTISYLDNGVIYVGSAYGDSQLFRLRGDKDESGSFLELLETYTNLGPIVDLCIVDLERQGQGQVVTCSGAFKDGSLRIIRNGIGINEQATIDLPGIKGLWSLKPDSSAEFDKYIILSFVGETRVLAMNEEELEETEIGGFQSDEQTIHCGNVVNNQFLQVTSKSIKLVDAGSLKEVSSWNPPADTKITVATCNRDQILIGTGGGHLVYIEIEGSTLREKSHKTLEHEISCLNMTPLGDNQRSNLCAVGVWTDITIRLLTLPDLNQVLKEPLGGEIIPRSVLLATFEGIHYLLCALGDGHLFTFTLHLEGGELRDKKKLSLGTQPIVLNTFNSNGQTHVFAASDRPTVIYSANKKLLYSNVNLKEVNQMCAFNSSSFPDSLAIATEESLTIGTIDDIQKLHIRTVPLGEMPRRICHQESTNTFCVLTVKFTVEANGEEVENGFVRLVDDQTFEVTSSFQLNQFETPGSVISCQFSDDKISYYVVGTAYALPTESEPSRGRLLVFCVQDGKLKLVTETETRGAVYSLNSFNGRLLAGINSKIQLYKWAETEDSAKQLISECGHHGHILALFVVSRGDFIIVGDLMKSISLLIFKPVENVIEEIARDYNPNWMTAVEVLDDDTYIGAENSFNLFTVRRNADAATDEERSRLEVCGQFHLGEFVNRFRRGSLVMKLPDVSSEEADIPTLVFGSVNGSIGVVASLTQENYAFFAKVQENINRVIKGVGGFSHNEWRSFSNERKTVEAKNFLDGDLIESFLDLKPDKMQEVVKGMDISVEELCKRIETLQQALH